MIFSKISVITEMAALQHPEHAKSFRTILKECEYFEENLSDLLLRYAISVLCTQSPIMLEIASEEHRHEIEYLLLSQVDAHNVH